MMEKIKKSIREDIISYLSSVCVCVGGGGGGGGGGGVRLYLNFSLILER